MAEAPNQAQGGAGASSGGAEAPVRNARGARRAGGLAVAVFGAAFLLALFPMRGFDTWWHLANGREIASGRGVPRTNLYSFTHPDHEVTPTHWLFGLGAYLVHAVAGVSGLVFVKAVLVAAAFVLAYALARRRGAGEIVVNRAAALVLVLAVLASRKRFLERPHLFTMLGLAGFAYLIHLFREAHARGERKRALWIAGALPAAAALWANFHAGSIFGVGIVLAEAAGELVSYLRSRLRDGAEDERTRAH